MIDFCIPKPIEAAQASKWAYFISPFQDYFRKITPFLGCFKCGVFGGKYSTLIVQFMSLWIVGVRPCFGVLPWKS
jgi:hypothetical protein